MKTVSLSGSPRVNVGKKGAANLRKNGSIPSVVYGGKEQIHFSILENNESIIKDYFVNGIPHKILIDKSGKIIGKWEVLLRRGGEVS